MKKKYNVSIGGPDTADNFIGNEDYRNIYWVFLEDAEDEWEWCFEGEIKEATGIDYITYAMNNGAFALTAGGSTDTLFHNKKKAAKVATWLKRQLKSLDILA